MKALSLYFNPACSKCRQARALLDERGVAYTIIEYLTTPPSQTELERIATMVGGPRAILRSKDLPEADLLAVSDTQILEWIASTPALLERPIAVCGDQAVVARPPELLNEFLERVLA